MISKCLRFTINGKPAGKQRPKFGNGHAYTPKETVNYESLVKMSFSERFPDHIPTENTIEIDMTAYFPIPKSLKKEQREKAESDILPYTKKPDCDNIIKIVLDALNGLAWHDDKQVYCINFAKYYSPQPRVEVDIYYEN